MASASAALYTLCGYRIQDAYGRTLSWCLRFKAVSLAVAVGLTDGFDSPEAMIAVGFGTITLADAVSIRRAAGEHAALLNRMVKRLNSEAPFEASILDEDLGHSGREVLAGVLFGILVSVCVCGVWDFWK